jgi:hypothetical protein
MRVILMLVKSNVYGDMRGNRGILGRWELKSLRDTTIKDLMELLPQDWIEGYNKQEGTLRLIGGSELVTASFKEFKVGGNYAFVAIDQAEEVPQDTIERLQGRIRMSKTTRGVPIPEYLRTVYGVGNPNGRSWHYKQWELNRLKGLRGDPDYDPRYLSIPCTTYDNEQNLPDDYISNQKQTLTPKKFRIYIGGSWEAFEGQVYDEWDFTTCVNKTNVIPGSSWKKFVGIDHGYPAAKVASFCALSPYNEWLVYDEVYMEDAKTEEFIGAIKSKLILHEREMGEAEGYTPFELERIWLWCCDPSMRRRAGEQTDGSHPSAANLTEMKMYTNEAIRQGFVMPLYPAQNEILAGNDKVNWLFWNNQPNRASLNHPKGRINPRCLRHIDTFESYHYDARTGKPADGQDDHCADSHRYATVTAFPGTHVPSVQQVLPTREEDIIESMGWGASGKHQPQHTFDHESGWI